MGYEYQYKGCKIRIWREAVNDDEYQYFVTVNETYIGLSNYHFPRKGLETEINKWIDRGQNQQELPLNVD